MEVKQGSDFQEIIDVIGRDAAFFLAGRIVHVALKDVPRASGRTDKSRNIYVPKRVNKRFLNLIGSPEIANKLCAAIGGSIVAIPSFANQVKRFMHTEVCRQYREGQTNKLVLAHLFDTSVRNINLILKKYEDAPIPKPPSREDALEFVQASKEISRLFNL